MDIIRRVSFSVECIAYRCGREVKARFAKNEKLKEQNLKLKI